MKNGNVISTISRIALWALLALFALGSAAEAQPNLTFKRVTVNWPTIEMYFSVGCDGNPAYNMTKQDFRIYENGVAVKEFTLWCPDPTIRCAISVSLVFDASGSMIGSGQAGAKAAGHAFVDMMDGVIDEASVIWFTSVVTVYQQMTTVKPMLHSAVDALPASGMTAVWDGGYAGLIELINNGVNQCRAVILMTDGGDNASSRQPAELIALANRHRIRIFTIGLGSSINSLELELIAQLTGGKYFQTPNAGQLSAIYQEISTIMFQGFQECIITYERECADGSLRTVELQLRNYCGGTDTKTKTYRAPLDSSTFKTLYMELGKGAGKGGTDIKIPLRLITPIDGDMFYPFQFTLEFDPSCVQFKSVSTPPGSLIEGLPISVTPVPTGALIQVTDRKLVNGSGLLMEFTFKASDPADTTCCEIRGINPKFDQGCFIPIINPGEICVYPRKPVVTCDIDGPKELVWMRPIKDYTPNPFSVTGRFYNTGDKEAFNTRFRITYNSADVQLITPLTDIQVGTPKDLPFGGFSEVTWQLAAKRRTNQVETQICITAIFDNHEEVVCCLKVKIPPTEPILECALDAPPIVADNVNLRYVPMPFPVTVTVTNVGGMRTDSVWATIILPKDLELATPDIPDRHTKRVVPSLLFPNQSGSTSWMVRHPNTDVEKSYIVEVWVKTANADSSKCEITITIPPLESPILSPRCYVPSALVFDENLDTYVPNPFTVRLTCVNNGNTEAFDVEGTIILPPDLEFDVPQPATKMFTPSNMLKYVPPAPAPELTWTVRWTKRYRYNVTPQIRWTVTGKNFMGVRLDSTEVRCAIPIPGLMPLFACDIEMPDSLALNATETDVEPNPFTVRYTVTNRSKQIGRITRLFISFPPDGLSLDPSSPNPMNQTLSLDLDKDESRTFEWVIRVQNRITRRLPLITVTALDDEGNEIRCEQYLPIANLKTALMCDVRTSEPELRYIPVLTEYEPTRFVISATLTNTGGANLNDVVAELEWTDPSGQDLVEFDPDYVDNTNPKTWGVLFPSLGQTFSWGFRLKNKNTTDVPQVLLFNIKYGSRETPLIAGGCEVPVTIEPVVAPKLICSLGGPDTVRFVVDRYDPTPFDIDVHIENIGTGDARDVKAYLLQDTRFTIISPTMRALGTLKAFSSTDLTGTNGFTVRVNPRDIDGYDTVRVTVVAEGAMTECLLPIYVERELRPQFELVCTSSAVLRFDDVLNDYTPNPFPVETRVKNVGDTRAKDCKLIFVGPPRFMPYDQVTTISLGDMEVNEERTITWQMVPWRRDVGGTETLLFQVHGSGGLGNRIVVEPCGVDIYVPPARAATYACDVTAQPISFDPTTGGYVPDPFEVTSTVRNTGLADGLGLFAEITVGSGLYVTSPTRVDLGGTLSPSGTSAPVRWTVRPIARATDGNEKVTVRYTDRFGNTTVCETMVFVPAAPEPGLLLGCTSDLLKLEVDKLRGEYVQSSFSIHATVGNNSGRSVFDVEVTAISMDADLKISPLSPNPVIVAPRLDHNAPTVSVSWAVNVVPRSKSGPIRVLFLVSGKDEQGRSVPTRECSVWIDVPAVGSPNLDCRVWTSVTSQGTEDRLIAYSETLGDYEGEKSAYGDYTVFTVSAEIQNLGEAQSNRVRATLLLPEYMALEAEESALKNVTPGDIAPGGGRATVSWKVRPLAVGEDKPLTFEIVVTSENHPNEKCTHDVTLQAAQRLVQLSLPDDVVGSYGEKVTVPVLVGETLGRDVFAYRLTIRYNPSQIRFLDATNANSLTARGWNGPQARVLVEQGAPEGNLVRTEDRTTGQPLSTSRTGALVFLRFEVVHNPEQIDLIALSDLEFVSNTQTDDNRLLWSSMNSVKDDEQGDVKLAFTDGAVTVSGDCVLPLTTATRLEQNRPNPFNPTTVITYRLGETGEYTLTLFDALGRKVRVLETGAKPAGTYTYVLDATGLTSGVYLYRLETPAYSDTKRMILSR
jgi:Mg-chelatase subunit ChlD